MENISNKKSKPFGVILDRIEEIFMIISGIAIGMSPLLVLL